MISPKEFILRSFKERSYLKKQWLLSVFSVIIENEENNKKLMEIPNALIRKDGKLFMNTSEGLIEVLGDPNNVLFRSYDPISLKAGDHPLIKEDVETTMGRLLTNVVALWEPLGDKHVYHNGEINGKYLENTIKKLMADNPPTKYGRKTIDQIKAEAEYYKDDPNKATVSQCLMVTQMIMFLECLSDSVVVGGDEEAFTVDPNILALKKKLMEENKDHLDDPVVVEKIINTLIEKDKEIQLTGNNQGFFIADRFITDNRKRMFLVFGMEPDFETGKFKLLDKSLADGWDLNQIHRYINQGISVSYDRGKNTGEGGALVNELTNLVPRVKVEVEDCGTTRGENIIVDSRYMNFYRGSYVIDKGVTKSIDPLIEGNVLKDGDIITVRMPTYCTVKDNCICKKCAGDALSGTPTILMSETIKIGTSFMMQRMKMSYSSSLKTFKCSLDEIIK